MPSCPTFSGADLFTSSQNSPGNDENSWDKMPSCPTFSGADLFTSSQNSPGNDENSWDKMASCPTFSGEEKQFKSRNRKILSRMLDCHRCYSQLVFPFIRGWKCPVVSLC